MARKAAIIGGGVIGGGWAARFLLNGWNVSVFDPDPEAERKISEVMANARAALPALSDIPMPKEGKLSFAQTITEAVEGTEYIQESVSERLDLKHRVFAPAAFTTTRKRCSMLALSLSPPNSLLKKPGSSWPASLGST